MKTIKHLTVIGASSLILAGAARAQYAYPPPGYPQPYQPGTMYVYGSDRAGTFYVSAGLGGALQQDLNIKSAGVKATFDPGFRGDFNFGFNFCDFGAIELDTGGIWNSFNKVNGQTLSSMDQRADLTQVPMLVDLIVKVPLRGGVTLYFGGGGGGVESELNVRGSGSLWGTGPAALEFSGTDTDFTFAYQGIAGLKCNIGWNMDVGVAYRFLGTGSHTWFDGDPFFNTHTGPTLSHSILATFTFRF